MSLVQSIVKTIRSIRQEYNLTKAKPEGILLVFLAYKQARSRLVDWKISIVHERKFILFETNMQVGFTHIMPIFSFAARY